MLLRNVKMTAARNRRRRSAGEGAAGRQKVFPEGYLFLEKQLIAHIT